MQPYILMSCGMANAKAHWLNVRCSWMLPGMQEQRMTWSRLLDIALLVATMHAGEALSIHSLLQFFI